MQSSMSGPQGCTCFLWVISVGISEEGEPGHPEHCNVVLSSPSPTAKVTLLQLQHDLRRNTRARLAGCPQNTAWKGSWWNKGGHTLHGSVSKELSMQPIYGQVCGVLMREFRSAFKTTIYVYWNSKDCKLVLLIFLNCRFKQTTFTQPWTALLPVFRPAECMTHISYCMWNETKSNWIFFFGCYLTFSIALFLLPVTPYIALSIDDKATKVLGWVFMVSDTTSAGFSVSLLDCSLIYKLKTKIGNFESTLFWNQSS